MSKLRKSILIIGILIIAVAASLGTALALYATGSIKTDPIELVYSIRPETKEYDGTPLKATDYRLDSGELVAGHVAEVTFIGEQTNVGASTSDLSVKIYDADGYDVSGRYTIKVEKSTLAVTPKHVKVQMPSQKVVYNGSKVNFTTYNIAEDSGDLVSGHVLAGSSENATLLNVGDTLPEDMKPLVFDKAGNDVTYNYEIECELGEIEIIPRPVSVRPVSKTKVYDGTVLISDEIEYLEGSLVEGQYAEFTINGGYEDRLIGVDSILTYVKDFKVYADVAGEKVDVTANYAVDAFESGLLSVTPRPVTIVAKSGQWQYDGSAHSFINDGVAEEVEGLAPTDVITDVHYIGSITDVGKADNVISSVDFTCDEKNYDVTLVKGTLEVYPYALHVVTGSGEKYYDGEPLSNSELQNVVLANSSHVYGIADGEEYKEITNAGSIVNEYILQIADGDGAPVTHNYDITYEYGTLTVKKMPVTVTLSDKEETEYDGTEKLPTLSDEDYFQLKAVDDESTENLKLTYRDFTPALHVRVMIDAGTYSYSVNFKEKSTSDNYILEVTNYGYLTVKARAISIKTGSDDKPYDGTPLTCATTPAVTSEKGLVGGHKFVLPKELPSILNVGTAKNDYAVTVTDADGNDKTPNYKITYDYGDLEITKCTVTVSLKHYVGGSSFTYSAKELLLDPEDAITLISPANVAKKSDFAVVPVNKIIAGVSSEPVKTLKDAGSYTYTVKIASAELAANFNVQINGGNATVIIDKCPVQVNVRDVSRVYSGESIQIDGSDVIHSLIDATRVLTREDFVVKYAAGELPEKHGEYKFGVGFAAATNTGVKDSKADNYELDVKNIVTGSANSTLTVTKYSVTINTPSLSVVYDGKEHSATDFTYTALANVSHRIIVAPETEGEAYSYPRVLGVTAEDVENVLTLQVLKGTEDVTENYDFINFNGKLKVTPRPVIITTGSDSKPYDGTVLECSTVDGDNLADGHYVQRAEGETLPSIIFYGTETNGYLVEIYDGEANIVTANYDVSYDYGELSITKVQITVTTGTDEDIVYDGEPHVKTDDIAVEGLEGFTGYSAVIRDEGAAPALTDVGTIPNVFDVEIYDTASSLVTENFDITYVYGKISVKPRPVTVTYDDDYLHGFIYSGEAVVLDIESVLLDVDAGEDGADGEEPLMLLDKTDFAVVINQKLIDAGEYEFTVKISEDKARNFAFNSPEGFVRIRPKQLYVSFVDGYSETFDNKVKKLSVENVLEDITDEDDNSLIWAVDGGENELLEGALITPADFEVYSVSGEMLNVNTYSYNIRFTDLQKSKNFTIVGRDGTFSIDPFRLEITYKDYEFTYGGEEIVIGTDALTLNTRLISNGDFKVSVDDGKTVCNADTYTYRVSITDEEFAQNFIFDTAACGTVVVNALPVTVTLKNYVFVYSGEAIEIDVADAVQISSPLLNSGNLALNLDEIIDTGDYTYGVDFAEGFDGAGNFELNVLGGKIKINPLTVNVTLKNPTKVYDGAEYDLNNNAVVLAEDSGLITDFTAFTATYIDGGDRTGAGSYNFTVTLNNANFKLNVAVGTVTITKREVTAYTADYSTPYTGNVVRQANIVNVSNIVSELHSFEAETATASTITDVGSVDNKVVCKILSKDDGKDVSANYTVNYVYGKLTVTARPVTITTATGEFNYDGQPHSNGALPDGGAIAGVNAKAELIPGLKLPEITNAGSVKNEFPVRITADDGEDITRNFAITYVYGTLTVKPIDVTVTLKDCESVYNGKEVTLTAGDCVAAKSSNLFEADDLQIIFDGSVKNAGTYAIKAKFKKDSVAANFDLTVNPATLTVKKADLTVTLGGIQLTYNGKAQSVKLSEAAVAVGANYDNLTYKNFRAVCDEEIKNAADYAYDVEFIGETYLNNYNLTTDTAAAKVTVKGVEITVQTKALKSEYSGKAVAVSAAEAIADITGDNADIAKVSEFAVKFDDAPVTPGTYEYTLEAANPDCKDNYIITYEGDSILTITKRKVDLVLKEFMMTQTEVDNMGGLTGNFDVSRYIEVSQFTPLLDGAKLVVREAGAGGDGNGEVILYAIDVIITDIDGKTVLGWLRIMDDGAEADLTGYIQSECYEFNLSSETLDTITTKITVIG